jgi:hypothetical protein
VSLSLLEALGKLTELNKSVVRSPCCNEPIVFYDSTGFGTSFGHAHYGRCSKCNRVVNF